MHVKKSHKNEYNFDKIEIIHWLCGSKLLFACNIEIILAINWKWWYLLSLKRNKKKHKSSFLSLVLLMALTKAAWLLYSTRESCKNPNNCSDAHPKLPENSKHNKWSRHLTIKLAWERFNGESVLPEIKVAVFRHVCRPTLLTGNVGNVLGFRAVLGVENNYVVEN